MKAENPASEPSMDEILASIRQIISSDPKKGEKSLLAQQNQEDILDLTEALPDEDEQTEHLMDGKLEKSKSASSHLQKEGGKHFTEVSSYSPQKSATTAKADAFLKDLSQKSNSEPILASLPSHKQKNTFEEPFVSQTAMSEAAQALHSLNKLAREKPKLPEPRLNDGIGGLTLEDLVRETLKPLLKEWLDTNLPTLVKWVVNEQVEKIVRQLGVAPYESPLEKPKMPPKL